VEEKGNILVSPATKDKAPMKEVHASVGDPSTAQENCMWPKTAERTTEDEHDDEALPSELTAEEKSDVPPPPATEDKAPMKEAFTSNRDPSQAKEPFTEVSKFLLQVPTGGREEEKHNELSQKDSKDSLRPPVNLCGFLSHLQVLMDLEESMKASPKTDMNPDKWNLAQRMFQVRCGLLNVLQDPAQKLEF
jgi:hypothetical protein